ncbi:hypothetical protein M8818_003048 [Zalaria obscura]|uniref:Uncharacterized protein n=1 Tax=Zalaria obscura TaxID=2024903 RepID=A0ACC3SGD8_9PEZI
MTADTSVEPKRGQMTEFRLECDEDKEYSSTAYCSFDQVAGLPDRRGWPGRPDQTIFTYSAYHGVVLSLVVGRKVGREVGGDQG